MGAGGDVVRGVRRRRAHPQPVPFRVGNQGRGCRSGDDDPGRGSRASVARSECAIRRSLEGLFDRARLPLGRRQALRGGAAGADVVGGRGLSKIRLHLQVRHTERFAASFSGVLRFGSEPHQFCAGAERGYRRIHRATDYRRTPDRGCHGRRGQPPEKRPLRRIHPHGNHAYFHRRRSHVISTGDW